MPKFRYKAKEGPDKVIDGVIDAVNSDAAVSIIAQKGLVPLDVFADESASMDAPVQKKNFAFSLFKRVKLNDVVEFTRQLSDLVEAAVPILRSLEIIAQQTQNPDMKVKVQEMHKTVRDGNSFSEALTHHTDIFSVFFINLVRTGEVSGKLKDVLKRLADYMESEQQTNARIKQALAYPMVIVCVGILTMFVLLTFVIPRLTVMFEDLGQELPLITKALIAVSGFFASFWWLIIIVGAVIALYFRQFLSTSQGRLRFDIWRLKMPALGSFIRYAEVGRLSRTMGTLIENGIVVNDALNSVWGTVDNAILKSELMVASTEVRDGASLNYALRDSIFFPDMALSMIAVGEETGRLDQSFHKIADTYERRTDQAAKTMVSLLGPLVLVVIMVFVTLVVLAMILPIFQMDLSI